MSGKDVSPPTTEQVESALFEQLDDNRLGEINFSEWCFLPGIADVVLSEEELLVSWADMDPEDTDTATRLQFGEWFNSDSALSARVMADANGKLFVLGAAYKAKYKKGGLMSMGMLTSMGTGFGNEVMKVSRSAMSGDSSQDALQAVDKLMGTAAAPRLDHFLPSVGGWCNVSSARTSHCLSTAAGGHKPRVIFKEDIEIAARKKAEVDVMRHQNTWRNGGAWLLEFDDDDLVGQTVDIETMGKGRVVEKLKKSGL